MGEGVNDFFENFKNFFKNYRSKKTKFSKIGGGMTLPLGKFLINFYFFKRKLNLFSCYTSILKWMYYISQLYDWCSCIWKNNIKSYWRLSWYNQLLYWSLYQLSNLFVKNYLFILEKYNFVFLASTSNDIDKQSNELIHRLNLIIEKTKLFLHNSRS